MATTVSCACGWHARGTEEDLVEALARHAEEAHGEKARPEEASPEIGEGCGC